eukprot:3459573-Pyramimonas_sp.AAC.2
MLRGGAGFTPSRSKVTKALLSRGFSRRPPAHSRTVTPGADISLVGQVDVWGYVGIKVIVAWAGQITLRGPQNHGSPQT